MSLEIAPVINKCADWSAISASWALFWICVAQLERLQSAADAAQKQEAAARAVLAAATEAARQGRLLSDEGRATAEAPILAPERWAAEQERKRGAAQQASLFTCFLLCANRADGDPSRRCSLGMSYAITHGEGCECTGAAEGAAGG